MRCFKLQRRNETKTQKKTNKCSMLTALSKNWVKVNHFVPWRQCLRFHPQQTHFHSGCSVEVIQVLAVSDGRDGLSTNSIYSIMWQSKKHFFPLLLPSPQSSADITLLPSTLTGFCTFAHCFVSIAPSTLLLSFFFTSISSMTLIPLFHACCASLFWQ